MNFILGGTSGLGAEIAKLYQEQGEETFVVGRSYDAATHGEGMAIDLADLEDVEKLRPHISEKLGGTTLKRFFWVTGIGYNGDFAEQPKPEVMAAVNFGNGLPIAQEVWCQMLASGETSNFVVISSTSGFKPRKDEAVYAGTKHALVGLARSLGLESERLDSSIKVALIMPGGMQTPFWEGNEPKAFKDFNDPAKVAAKIVDSVAAQNEPFYEEIMERGTV